MSDCSICGGVREGFHGHQHVPQRMYMFADKNKGSICIYTIALFVALFLILRNNRR